MNTNQVKQRGGNRKAQMKKIIIIVLALIVIAGAAILVISKDDTKESNGSQTSTQAAEQPKEQKVTITTVEQAETKLKESGVVLGEKSDAYYQVIGARDGAKYGSGEPTALEVYVFNTDSQANDAKTQVQTEDNTIVVGGNVLVLIHSKNQTVAQNVQAALN